MNNFYKTRFYPLPNWDGGEENDRRSEGSPVMIFAKNLQVIGPVKAEAVHTWQRFKMIAT